MLVTHDFIPFCFSSDSSQLKNDDDIFMTVSSLILVILPSLISRDFQLKKKQNSLYLKLSFNLETLFEAKVSKTFENVSKTSKFVIFRSLCILSIFLVMISFINSKKNSFSPIFGRKSRQIVKCTTTYVHNSFNLSSMRVKFPRLIHSFRVV